MNFYVKDGKIYPMNTPVQKIMVNDEDDLELLTGFAPGSVAYTAGEESRWQVDPDGEWQEITGSGGGSGGATIVHVNRVDNVSTIDMTAGEIYQAFRKGLVVIETPKEGNVDGDICILYTAWDAGDGYWFYFLYPDDNDEKSSPMTILFSAQNSDDYPTLFVPDLDDDNDPLEQQA